jgi:type I restriction enzyme, R subunit
MPAFENAGGWGKADRIFDGRLADLLRELNTAIAA